MEEMMMMMRRKQQTNCMSNSDSPSPPQPSLAMHKNSQTISKVKPKIRIIHIFAPEIIKTDVANFRELVQRLTGKPAEKKISKIKKPQKTTARSREESKPAMNKAITGCYRNFESRERIIKEEEIWRSSINDNNSGGFLSGFADLDGCFMQELGGEFPLFHPCEASHHLHVFEESHQLLS